MEDEQIYIISWLMFLTVCLAGYAYFGIKNEGGSSIYGRYNIENVQNKNNPFIKIFFIDIPAYYSMFIFEIPVLFPILYNFFFKSIAFKKVKYQILHGSLSMFGQGGETSSGYSEKSSFVLSHPPRYVNDDEFHKDMILLLFLFHYIYRAIIYPYLFLLHARPWKLYAVLVAITFNSMFAPLQSYYHINYGADVSGWSSSSIRFVGLILFFYGFFSNIYCDTLLQNLRKGPDDKNYYIPRGYLFDYVTGANFFSEAVEWFGFSLFSGNLVAFSYFLMTVANTINRATAHHNWYLKKFPEEYPRNRKIYFPYFY